MLNNEVFLFILTRTLCWTLNICGDLFKAETLEWNKLSWYMEYVYELIWHSTIRISISYHVLRQDISLKIPRTSLRSGLSFNDLMFPQKSEVNAKRDIPQSKMLRQDPYNDRELSMSMQYISSFDLRKYSIH